AVLDWTGGQPFLTQKVCRLIGRSEGRPEMRPPGPQVWGDMSRGEGGIVEWVGEVVRERVLMNWEGQDDPEHLKTIRDRLLHSEAQQGRLLGLYQAVVEAGELAVVDGPDQMMLRLSGLVVKRDGVLRVYNRIYREVFDRAWVAGAIAVAGIAVPSSIDARRNLDTTKVEIAALQKEREALEKKRNKLLADVSLRDDELNYIVSEVQKKRWRKESTSMVDASAEVREADRAVKSVDTFNTSNIIVKYFYQTTDNVEQDIVATELKRKAFRLICK
ncbi:MAG: hypothetical protein HC860_25955, partial [Alkalinema sp. RU_4_3]|nr:hypothetical protein [Alkalinema sp. RU_4_3]